MPAWADDGHAREGTQAHTREVTSAVMSGQGLAAEAAEAWRKEAAPAQAWMRHRTSERGLLTLVFRCWRERVEHDTPGINNDSSRWRVRTERAQRVGPRTRRGARRNGGPSQQSDERKFADAQLSNFAQVAGGYAWSPWREGSARVQEGSDDEGDDDRDGAVDEAQLARWKLKCDVMRVATYYRVTGARERAEARGRSAQTRARFRAWAASVVQARRDDEVAERPAGQARDGGRAARKRQMAPGAYREGRTNKQRATQEEVARRRLHSRRQRRGSTAADTQVGKRLRDDMCKVATRSVRQRRERFGDG